MESLVSALTSFLSWIQMPAVICFALALVFAGYELIFVGGEQGTATGKKTILIAVIGFIIIKAANQLATSLGGKISF